MKIRVSVIGLSIMRQLRIIKPIAVVWGSCKLIWRFMKVRVTYLMMMRRT